MAHVHVRTGLALLLMALALSSVPAEAQAINTPGGGPIQRAVAHELDRLKVRPAATAARVMRQQAVPRNRSWIRRHPALFGALVGFGGGFLIGYAAGDDGVFNDYVASFNGLVLGGIGAGTGAIAGAVAGALAD